MVCGIGSRGSLPLPRPACTLTLRRGNHPAAGRGPLAVPELKEEGLVRLPNTTLRIQRLDIEDACDITDAVLDALMPLAAGAGVQQHAGVTGGAVRVCAARPQSRMFPFFSNFCRGPSELDWQGAAASSFLSACVDALV